MLADLRFALRLLVTRPAFSAVVVLTLALGIGANTVIFSVVDGVLLRRTPVADLDRLVLVWETDRNSDTTREPASLPDYLDFRERSRTLDAAAAILAGEVNMAPPSGDPVRLAALRVTHGLLPTLGLAPRVGRGFTAAEDVAGGPPVALISESLWTRAFDRDPGIAGRTIRLDDVEHTIVGVVGDEADFGVLQTLSSAAYARGYADRGARVSVDVWRPLAADAESLPRSTHPIFVVGRLAPGATRADAQLELAAIAADLERAYPENDGRGVFVEPFGEVVFGRVRPALLVLLGAVGLVLLVACVNVANLLLARGTARRREVAVRSALGASGTRLARQFLVESVVLTLAGAAAGVALAVAGLRALVAIAPPDVPRLETIGLDARVLAATLGVSLAVGFAFGLVPLLQSRRVDVQASLKSAGPHGATSGRDRGRLRRVLVVSELALAVMLVVGAGLLIRSFGQVMDVDPGFRTEGVLKAEYQLPATRYPVDFRRYPDLAEMHAFTGALVRRAAALPGVSSAAVAGNHPLDPGFTNSFTIVGREAEARAWPEISVRRVTPGYFDTVGLELRAGRLFGEGDGTRDGAVSIVNEAAVRRFFAGRDPLGAEIRFWGASRRVVGVVADEKFQGLAEASPIAIYVPLAQAPSANGAGVLLVRTAGDPAALAGAVRGAIREIDPGLAVFGIEPLETTMARSVGQRRFAMLLLGLFAALALALAAIGVHGVIAYGVAERTREIGIRLALGAPPSLVRRLVVREGFALTAAGLALGLAGAAALSRLLASLLYGVTPTDPATFAAVAAVLAGVAIVATWAPAVRAARVEPARALRVE